MRTGRVCATMAAGLLLLAAAGCGGSSQPAGGTASKGGGSSHAAAPPAGAKLTSVVLGKAVNTMPFTVAEIAQQEGFLQQQGLKLKVLVMHGSSNANAALLGGSIQFTMVDSIPLAIARSKKVPLIAVEGIDHGVPIQMILAKKWITAHHLSAGASLSARVKGLQGATLGHAGPTDLKLTDMLLQRYHVPTSAIKVETLSGGAAEAAALTHGAIDGFAITPPTSLQVVAQGHAERWINFKNVKGLGQMQYDILVTSTQYAKAHPKTVGAMATAIAEADNFLLTHPQQALKVEQKLWPSISPSVIKNTIGLISWNRNGQQTAAGWQEADTIINKLGFVKGGHFQAVQGTEWTNQYVNQAALKGK